MIPLREREREWANDKVFFFSTQLDFMIFFSGFLHCYEWTELESESEHRMNSSVYFDDGT